MLASAFRPSADNTCDSVVGHSQHSGGSSVPDVGADPQHCVFKCMCPTVVLFLLEMELALLCCCGLDEERWHCTAVIEVA